MPNHIQNRLTFNGTPEEVIHAMNAIKSAEGDARVDFNRIVEMPKSLNTQMHSGIEMAISASLMLPVHSDPIIGALERNSRLNAKSPLDLSEEDFEKYLISLKNVKNHGHMNWHSWSIENWGTKWNAYGTPDKRDNDTTIFFQTAWSAPVDIIQKLSAKLPDVEIELLYADEDTSYNTGRISFLAGEVRSAIQPEGGSKDGYDIYFELNPGDVGDYQLVDGKYHYIEEDEQQ